MTKMQPRNNPLNKIFLIDGEPRKVIHATACSYPADGLPLWNITTADGLELQDWYPENEIKGD